MALILRAAIKNETFCKISGSTSYEIPPTNMNGEARQLGNHHAMLMPGPYHYKGVFAGKTGSTDQAGNTLVTACKKKDITLICMVMQTQEGGYAYVPADATAEDIESQDTPQGDLIASQYLYQGIPVGTALAAATASVSDPEAASGELAPTQGISEEDESSLLDVRPVAEGQKKVYYAIIGVLSFLILLCLFLIIKMVRKDKG